MPITRLVAGLYIASIDEVAEESTSQFDTVVSVCQDTRESNVGCQYQQFNIADGREAQREWGGSVDYIVFQRAAQYAIQSVSLGDTLIHCHRGQNRSAAICAAVIATQYDYDFDEAVDLVERRNPRTELSPLMYVFARRFAREY